MKSICIFLLGESSQLGFDYKHELKLIGMDQVFVLVGHAHYKYGLFLQLL